MSKKNIIIIAVSISITMLEILFNPRGITALVVFDLELSYEVNSFELTVSDHTNDSDFEIYSYKKPDNSAFQSGDHIEIFIKRSDLERMSALKLKGIFRNSDSENSQSLLFEIRLDQLENGKSCLLPVSMIIDQDAEI